MTFRSKAIFLGTIVSCLVAAYYWRSGLTDAGQRLTVGSGQDSIVLSMKSSIMHVNSGEQLHTIVLHGHLGTISANGLCERGEHHLGCSYLNNSFQVKHGIVSVGDGSGDINTYTVSWVASSAAPDSADSNGLMCVQLNAEELWYGGPSLFYQRWPINKQPTPVQPYISKDIISNPSNYGSVLERYWLASSGFALYVTGDDDLVTGDDDLAYGFNTETGLCLGSKTSLSVVMVTGSNPKVTHQYMLETYLGFPKSTPLDAVFGAPIWSTWAQFKVHVNESIILAFSKDIVKHGFPISQLEVDDMYTPTYGDFLLDPVKFPSQSKSFRELHEMGISVTSWVIPFANVDSKAFQDGHKQGYLVKSAVTGVTSLVNWWQGVGGLVDFTNPAAVDWFKKRLSVLQKDGIDSFKFDAGEACYLPVDSGFNPSLFTRRYAEVAASFGGRVEVRAAYRSQETPIFVRMMDKGSVWGFNNGLATLIPSALHMSIIGYPFILPDMIGGNAYADDTSDGSLFNNFLEGSIPERELYIRWIQITAFLPTMQFSIAPWQYDNEVIDIARKFTLLHQQYVTPIILQLAQECTRSGAPIIRPIWWVSPNDPMAFSSEDEFLIGDSVLVAPVVSKGATSRSIYFPTGKWKDMTSNHGVISGPTTLTQFSAPLHEVPYFELLH